MKPAGAALLGTLLAALALALSWVLAQQAQTSAMLQRNAALQWHWRAEAQADFWLARAQEQVWQATAEWQCRRLSAQWHACIRVLAARRALLCLYGQPAPLTYPLVRVRYLWGETDEPRQRYRVQPGGWIDFLPPGIACPATGE